MPNASGVGSPLLNLHVQVCIVSVLLCLFKIVEKTMLARARSNDAVDARTPVAMPRNDPPVKLSFWRLALAYLSRVDTKRACLPLEQETEGHR